MSCLQTTTTDFLVTNPDRAASEPAWFAVQTRPRHEKKVSAELREKGIEAFLPTVSAIRKWSDRRRVVELPLFSQYVFVRIAPAVQDRIAVLRSNGVISFVGPRGIGIPIPAEQIERVQTVVEQNLAIEPHPFLNVGRRIRIRGGALDGLEGILTAVNGDQTLVMSVELIQRSLAMRIAGFAVEAVEAEAGRM